MDYNEKEKEYEKQDKEIEEIFKRRDVKENRDIQEVIERYSKSKEKSVTNAEIKREKSKKRKHDRRRTIIALLLAGTTLISLYSLSKNRTRINNPITIISEQQEISDKIDSTIIKYQKMMEKNSEYAIESFNSRDANYEPLVFYDDDNISNFVTVITDAAKISEEEFRCAVLAAYKIINEPYRQEVLDKGFKKANENPKETIFKIPTSVQEYFETLGYEDIQEYNNNERKNIKRLAGTEIKTGGFCLLFFTI